MKSYDTLSVVNNTPPECLVSELSELKSDEISVRSECAFFLLRATSVQLLRKHLEAERRCLRHFVMDSIISSQRAISFPPFLLFLHYNFSHSDST